MVRAYRATSRRPGPAHQIRGRLCTTPTTRRKQKMNVVIGVFTVWLVVGLIVVACIMIGARR